MAVSGTEGREYWEQPPDDEKGLTRAYWNDPWPEMQGMLTAEWIVEYDKAVGGMIRPLDPDLLKTASYELTLGPNCVVEGEDVVLDPGNPTLEIPPNSIALVPMRQVLCLPHYIVGRFDLQIRFIYKGLLLGTGPQVDPGFQGALSCPLHNISNSPIHINLGQAFAKIDFAKTVPHSEEISQAWQGIDTEKELAEWLKRDAPETARLFKDGVPEWRRPITGYLENNQRPQSSVRELRDELRTWQRNIRRVGLGTAAVILITVFLAIPGIVLGVADIVRDALATKESVAESDAALQRRLDRQEQQIRELKADVARALRR